MTSPHIISTLLLAILALPVQAMPSISAPQAAALFEVTRATLPCASQVAAQLEAANLEANLPVLGDEYLSQSFVDITQNLIIEIGAEDTPIGTQFSATMTISDTTPQYLQLFTQSFLEQAGLADSTASSFRHTFANGPMVLVFDFKQTTKQTVIHATMSPLKAGEDTGCRTR